MALRHRKDDGLAPALVPPDTVLAREAVVEDTSVLAGEGAVSLRDGELPCEGPRIDGDGVERGEQLLELRSRRLVHRAPVELVPLHLEAALGRGLDRHRLADAVRHEVALRDRLAELVAEGRLLDLEEAEGVAHEVAVHEVGRFTRRLRRARSRGEAELDAVEVPEHAAPFAIDRAMALVGDDEVEVARGELAVLGNHGLEGRDGDALRAVEAAAGAKDVAGVVVEVVGEGVLGLAGEGDPVHEEEDAGDRPGFEQALDEGSRGAGLAGPCRHLDEQLPASMRHLVREGVDAVELVAAVDDPPVDRDVGEGAADRARRDSAFQILLRVEGRDRSCVGVRVPVEEPHLVAVREEDERDLELLRVVAPLVLGGDRVDARALGLHHRHRPPGAVA